MGSTVGRLLAFLHRNVQARVLIVGLDAAGKTTMLYMLKLNEIITTIPTIGFNVETVKHGGVEFVCWDVSGRSGIRPLWRHYYQDTQAVIFVVDSADRERISEVRSDMMKMMGESDLGGVHLLVVANKQDLKDAMSVEELTEILALREMKERSWHIVGASAKLGEGLHEGLDWLATQIAHSVSKEKLKEPMVQTSRGIEQTTSFLSTLPRWFGSLGKKWLSSGQGKEENEEGEE